VHVDRLSDGNEGESVLDPHVASAPARVPINAPAASDAGPSTEAGKLAASAKNEALRKLEPAKFCFLNHSSCIQFLVTIRNSSLQLAYFHGVFSVHIPALWSIPLQSFNELLCGNTFKGL
jgi:hypothetical protein